jgi:hypothetical protein
MPYQHSSTRGRPNRGSERLLRQALTQSRVVNELHFLLWRPRFQNGDHWDAGWMCREHALMTAGLGALLGFRAYLAWGKLALVGDEEGVSAKRMMSVSDPHSWTMFEGIGVYDLSLNLTQAAEIKWKPWPTTVLAGPSSTTAICFQLFTYDKSDDWERTKVSALQTDGFHMLYFGSSIELLSKRYLKGALEFINSPLSDDLRQVDDLEIYSKAVRHLWGILNRRRNCFSVKGISQANAWKEISEMENGATEWIAREASLPSD